MLTVSRRDTDLAIPEVEAAETMRLAPGDGTGSSSGNRKSWPKLSKLSFEKIASSSSSSTPRE
jgi:hypothetical protein